MFEEFYSKWIKFHEEQANQHMLGDIKKWMYHSRELKNYRTMLERTNKNQA